MKVLGQDACGKVIGVKSGAEFTRPVYYFMRRLHKLRAWILPLLTLQTFAFWMLVPYLRFLAFIY